MECSRAQSFYHAALGKHQRIKESLNVEEKKIAKKRCQSVSSLGDIRLLEPTPVWKEFPRQQKAFDFAQTCYQSVAIFAFESPSFSCNGSRRYLVTTYYEFCRRYISMPRPLHFYEVITEDTVCHLYFDLEFQLVLNQTVDPLLLLETFIQYVCCHLRLGFGVSCDRRRIIDLDSSTDVKFSRHLVFRLPGAAFRNNVVAGYFVKNLCQSLRQLKERGGCREAIHGGLTGEECSCPSTGKLLQLFVRTKKEVPSLICDEAVYTRNRNFRLLRSSKLGKTARLTLSKESKYQSHNAVDPSRPQWSRLFNLLMDSLVCNVLPEHCSRVLDTASKQGNSNVSQERWKRDVPTVTGKDRCQLSPYPLVDQFISSQLFREGVQGHIRRWSWFAQGKMMIYDIANYRWCENIGRHHKSNNIMLIADLKRGVFYQKCHDPDCRRVNFASNEWPIPVECNPVCVVPARDMTTPSGNKDDDSIIQEKLEDNDLLCNISIENILGESEEDSNDDRKGLTDDVILDDTVSSTPILEKLPQHQDDFTLSEREFSSFLASDEELS